jgi:hypothetical protein
MKIGLLAQASSSILNREDDADISPGDRGRRFINCLLYKASKPQEISLALAIFGLLNGGSLFFFSHDHKRIKLAVACAAYPRSKVDTAPILQHKSNEMEFVNIAIPLSKLRQGGVQADDAADTMSLDNEVDRTLDLCPMTDYWHRSTTEEFKDLSYIQILERYYLKAIYCFHW